jgi:hypothetical protein
VEGRSHSLDIVVCGVSAENNNINDGTSVECATVWRYKVNLCYFYRTGEGACH